MAILFRKPTEKAENRRIFRAERETPFLMPTSFPRPLRVIVFGLVGISRGKRGDVPIAKKNVAASSAEVVVVGCGSAVRDAVASGQFVAAASESSVVDDSNAE